MSITSKEKLWHTQFDSLKPVVPRSCGGSPPRSATPGPGEVRIRHEAVGLNFADTYFRTGLYPAALPAGMGVEAAGVIEAVGAGVTTSRPVTASPTPAARWARTAPSG